VKGLLVLFFGAAAACAAGPDRLAPLDESSYRQLLDSNRGKVVLIDFWATWCAPCRDEMPRLVKLETSLREQGLRLITISADEPEDEAQARKFLQRQKAPSPAFLKRVKNDEKFIDSIDAQWSGALPALFLYDRAGRKARSFIGETDIKELEAAIRKLLER
jgi:thiol-disulfide isomerase/thioredoxin